jgi:hypothetical protein
MSLKSNLKKLAIYLSTKRPSKRFSMSTYTRDTRHTDAMHPTGVEILNPQEQKSIPECNTVCCALGCGIRAGVPAGRSDDWNAYSRKFIEHEGQYDWLFDYNWKFYDNTPKGAAYRIGYMIKCGIPEWFEYPYSAKDRPGQYKECLRIGKQYIDSLK